MVVIIHDKYEEMDKESIPELADLLGHIKCVETVYGLQAEHSLIKLHARVLIDLRNATKTLKQLVQG